MLLSIAGESWEETNFTFETWPEAKASGRYLFGQVPALELEDGTVMVQTPAIVQYLGRKFGLYPEDPLEAYNVDVINASIADVTEAWVTIIFRTPEDKKAEAMEKFVSGTLNTNLAAWEKILEGGKSFIANDKLSIADAGVFLILETFEKISPESVSKFPNLVRFLEEFKAIPNVAAYLSSDKRPPPSSS